MKSFSALSVNMVLLLLTVLAKRALSVENNDNCESCATCLPDAVIAAHITTISGTAFKNCITLKSIVMHDGVTTLAGRASHFEGCTSLVNMTLSNALTDIPGKFCLGCVSLTSVTFPESLVVIQPSAFAGCVSLPLIILPDSVENIGGSAFRDCTSMASMNIPNSLRIIASAAFQNSGLKSVTFPDVPSGSVPVIEMGSSAFKECASLESVVLGSSLERVDKEAFMYCPALKTVTISFDPVASRAFESATFQGCTSLTTVIFTTGMLTEAVDSFVGPGTFAGCTALESIALPRVSVLPNNVFNGCTALSSVTIPDTVTEIDSYAFNGCTSLSSIALPPSLTRIYSDAFANTGMTSLRYSPKFAPLTFGGTLVLIATIDICDSGVSSETTFDSSYIGIETIIVCEIDPSAQPTGSPSNAPSGVPSSTPSNAPSGQPSNTPSSAPTSSPTKQRVTKPTRQVKTEHTQRVTEHISKQKVKSFVHYKMGRPDQRERVVQSEFVDTRITELLASVFNEDRGAQRQVNAKAAAPRKKGSNARNREL